MSRQIQCVFDERVEKGNEGKTITLVGNLYTEEIQKNHVCVCCDGTGLKVLYFSLLSTFNVETPLDYDDNDVHENTMYERY